MSKTKAIGIFDSGIGGLTVMKEIMEKLPNEKLIYFGDTARVPYGDKSPETILRYSIENSIFLMEYQVKMLVIACNTASAYAVNKLKQILKIPVIDVVSPGADKAVSCTKNNKIAVLATRATTQSGVYPLEIKKRKPEAEVYSVACPLLVPLIEEHYFDHVATRLIIRDYLAPLKNTEIDTLLLGCTHYPLLRNLIQEEIGPEVVLIDSASSCAEYVAVHLEREELHSNLDQSPNHAYFASDYPEKFKVHGTKFLGRDILQVEKPKTMDLFQN